MSLTREEFARKLLEHQKILLLTHCRPDGDTVGSAAALAAALRKSGRKAYLLPNPDITPINACYCEPFWAPESFKPDCIAAVDIASRSMLPENAAAYDGCIDLAVDHHPSQEFFARETCLDASAAACGEIVYDICRCIAPMDSEIASYLYAAISTDTGCFLFSNVTAATHRITAELMEAGLDPYLINKRHFMTKSLARLRMESALVAGMELFDGGRIAVMSLPLSLMEELGATENDADNIASFTNVLEGVDCGMMLRELKQGVWKISLRTGARVNATKVCGLLGGGGHAAAAGCTLHGSREEARDTMLKAIYEVVHG